MKKELPYNGVHLASLSSNMRNTKDIETCAKTVQSVATNYAIQKITKNIDSLPAKTNVTSTRPLHIPYFAHNHKQHFIKAISKALNEMKDRHQSIVIMHNPLLLSSKDIQKSLIECGEEENNILRHPQKRNNDNVERLKHYLRNPNGFYIVPQDNFVGMEAKSIIFFIGARGDETDIDNTTSIRCHILRAVSNLIIIQSLNINEYGNKYMFVLDNVDVDPSFIQCQGEMKFDACKCKSNDMHSKSANPTNVLEHPNNYLQDKLICQSCMIWCHQDHKERSCVKLGSSPPYSLFPGLFRMMFVDGVWRVKCSILGETKCYCNVITNCQLMKKGQHNLSTVDTLKYFDLKIESCILLSLWVLIYLFNHHLSLCLSIMFLTFLFSGLKIIVRTRGHNFLTLDTLRSNELKISSIFLILWILLSVLIYFVHRSFIMFLMPLWIFAIPFIMPDISCPFVITFICTIMYFVISTFVLS